jgi:hypothetical protein
MDYANCEELIRKLRTLSDKEATKKLPGAPCQRIVEVDIYKHVSFRISAGVFPMIGKAVSVQVHGCQELTSESPRGVEQCGDVGIGDAH